MRDALGISVGGAVLQRIADNWPSSVKQGAAGERVALFRSQDAVCFRYKARMFSLHDRDSLFVESAFCAYKNSSCMNSRSWPTRQEILC